MNFKKLAAISVAIVLSSFIVSSHTTTEPSKNPITNGTDFKDPQSYGNHAKVEESHSNGQGLIQWFKEFLGVNQEPAHKVENSISQRKAASWVMQTYRVNVVNEVFYVKKAEFINITESKYPSFYKMHFRSLEAKGWKTKTVLVDKKGSKVFFPRPIQFPKNYKVKPASKVLK